MSRGAFIVLEGLDRSGKTTQCKVIVEHLQASGVKARFQPYPDRSEPTTGPRIDSFLKTATSPYADAEAIHALFAENRRILDAKLRADLAAGVTVIADRYSFSGISYTAAKEDPKIPLNAACTTEVGLLKPDLVIYLRVDSAIAAQRAGFGDEALEKAEFQQAVRGKMEMLINSRFWKIVDANGSIEDVSAHLRELVDETRLTPLDEPASFTLADFHATERVIERA